MRDIVEMARAAEKNERLSDGALYGKLADEIERLRKIELWAGALVEECDGGRLPPSLGTLAKLESALWLEWKALSDVNPKSEERVVNKPAK